MDLKKLREMAELMCDKPWFIEDDSIRVDLDPVATDTVADCTVEVCKKEELPNVLLSLIERIQTSEAEILEQCRLNGMGAQRELALMTKLEIAVEALENIRSDSPWQIGAVAGKALAKIKDK